VKHRRVRGKARPDRGRSVIACPVGELRQGRPVWLLLQIRGARLRAGYHEAVETGVPKLGDIPVSRGNLLPAAIAARNVRQGVEPQAHNAVAGRRTDEFDELALGRFQGGIGHVVDEPDLDAARALADLAQVVFADDGERHAPALYSAAAIRRCSPSAASSA
jgi:hypothetical protein